MMKLENKLLTWKSTNDSEFTHTTELNGKIFYIRLNDFPDEHMYTLIYDGIELLSFDDWPKYWQLQK